MQNSSWKRSGGIWRRSSFVSSGIFAHSAGSSSRSRRSAGMRFFQNADCSARSTAMRFLSRWIFSISSRDFGQRKSMTAPCGLDPEVAMPEAAVGVKLGGASLPRDPPALDDGVAVGELHQPLDVLVDHQDRLARGAQALEAFPDLFAH